MGRSHMIKIMFYIKDPNGGTGRFIEQMIRLLPKSKFKIKVLTHIRPRGFFLKTETIGNPIKKQSCLSLFTILESLRNTILVFKKIRQYKPDILFSIDIYANITSSLLKLLGVVPILIHSSHINLLTHISNQRTRTMRVFMKTIIILFYKLSDSHQVPSNGLRTQVVEKFHVPSSKAICLQNPIDYKNIKTLSSQDIKDETIKRLLIDSNYNNVFSMARFEDQKNFSLLLESFKQAHNKNNNLRLYILGSGTMRREIERKIFDLHIEKYTFLLGWQKNPYKFLRYADIFVFLSNYEGMPYALLEAKALNIFTIASDVDFGPREIIDPSSGYLIKNKNPKQIANLICKAISSGAYKKIDRKQFCEKGIQEYKRIKGLFIQYFEGMRQHYRTPR